MRLSLLIAILGLVAAPIAAETVRIDGGLFTQPILVGEEQQTIEIDSFLMDATQVSNAEFLTFVQSHPRWQRSNTPRVFQDGGYLAHWPGNLHLGDGNAAADRPVTRVSWFAARAYCRANGGRLPTLDEWEFVSARERQLRGDDDAYAHAIFAWYGNPGADQLGAVGGNPPGPLGVHDLHGLVLEWVEDFQLLTTIGDSTDLLNGSCGDTARLMPDFDQASYATFLRYQSRSNYTARSTTSTLGFRCAYDLESNQ